jgi:hypothetical protein
MLSPELLYWRRILKVIKVVALLMKGASSTAIKKLNGELWP